MRNVPPLTVTAPPLAVRVVAPRIVPPLTVTAPVLDVLNVLVPATVTPETVHAELDAVAVIVVVPKNFPPVIVLLAPDAVSVVVP